MDNYESLKNCIISRRSCRNFSIKEVDKNVIRNLIEVAAWAPSSGNRQNWYFIVIDDPKIKEDISNLADVRQHYIYKAPVLILVFYDFLQERGHELNAPYITAGMIIQNLLLLIHAYGLGAIYIADVKKAKGLNKAVNASDFLAPMGIICVGHPDKMNEFFPPPRKNLNDIISYNKCNKSRPDFPDDIRPNKWSYEQFSEFRGHIVWYKGFDIDNRYNHVEPITSGSVVSRYYYKLLGKEIHLFNRKVTILVFLPYGGEGLINLEMISFGKIETIYSFEISEKIETFIKQRMNRLFSEKDRAIFKYIRNKSKEGISIDLNDESVDLINCFFRIEQFENKKNVLDEFNRILVKDGRLFIITKNPKHEYIFRKRKTKTYRLGRNWNRGPEKSLSIRDYLSLFQKTNFKIIRIVELDPGYYKVPHLAIRLILRVLGILKLNLFKTKIENVIKRSFSAYKYFIFELTK